jgi:hypothetical protein
MSAAWYFWKDEASCGKALGRAGSLCAPVLSHSTTEDFASLLFHFASQIRGNKKYGQLFYFTGYKYGQFVGKERQNLKII